MTNYNDELMPQNGVGENNNNEVLQENQINDEIPEPEIHLTISFDKTAVFLNTIVTDTRQIVTEEQVLEKLQEKGIVYGIKKDEIKEYCNEKQYFKEIICAEGLQPIDQHDGKLKYNFKKVVELKPQERENGIVDYHDLGLVQQIKAGEALCEIEMPDDGSDGIDVFGEVICYKKGKVPRLPMGRNTVVSDDGMKLLAKIDGLINYNSIVINIDDVCLIKGDVDNSTGNIVFSGSVVIQGDVRTGFTVDSGKDVIVRGVVEGATIKAKGDIKVTAGVIGINKALLISGGNIYAKYFESSAVKCEGSVYADFYINSYVNAGENICAEGAKASLLGGAYTAGKVICSGTIGSDNGFETVVTIFSQNLMNMYQKSQDSLYKGAIKKKQEKLEILAQINSKLNNYKPNNHQQVEVYNNLIMAKKQIEGNIKEIESEIVKILPKQDNTKYRIVAKKNIYRGVKMTIGPFIEKFMVNESHMTYYMGEDGITKIIAEQSDYIERGR